jgi:single-strand DNA-binding protein
MQYYWIKEILFSGLEQKEKMSVNKVFLIGNAGQDPELRNVGDTQVAKVSMATSEKWKDKQGNKQEKTEWHNLEIWGAQAKVAGDYITKGLKFAVEGKLQYDSWTDDDGKKQFRTKIRVTSLELLGSGKASSPQAEQSQSPQPPSSGNPQIGDVDDLPF